MTVIKMFKMKNLFRGFECSGHTGYGEFGKDVLCAAISGITQSIVIGLEDVCKIDLELTRNDSKGYIKVLIPNNVDGAVIAKSQVLLETLYLSMQDLIEGYSKYISMEVIEDVY